MNKNVLLIAFDSDMVDTVREMLNSASIELNVAGNESVAKTLLDKKKFELVITEALLPKSHGVTICQYVKENFRKIPVIIIGDRLESDDLLNEAVKKGTCDYIEKPLDKSRFRELVLERLYMKDVEQHGDKAVEETTNIYVIPYLAQIDAEKEKKQSGTDNFKAIIENLKKEENDSFEIDLG